MADHQEGDSQELLRRGPWAPKEDAELRRLVNKHGECNWVNISKALGTRSAKQCRERWFQNLKPSLNHTPISPGEAREIKRLVEERGKKWAEIARALGTGRSDNAIKNWWNGSQNKENRRMRGRASLAHAQSQLSLEPARGGDHAYLDSYGHQPPLYNNPPEPPYTGGYPASSRQLSNDSGSLAAPTSQPYLPTGQQRLPPLPASSHNRDNAAYAYASAHLKYAGPPVHIDEDQKRSLEGPWNPSSRKLSTAPSNHRVSLLPSSWTDGGLRPDPFQTMPYNQGQGAQQATVLMSPVSEGAPSLMSDHGSVFSTPGTMRRGSSPYSHYSPMDRSGTGRQADALPGESQQKNNRPSVINALWSPQYSSQWQRRESQPSRAVSPKMTWQATPTVLPPLRYAEGQQAEQQKPPLRTRDGRNLLND